MLHVQEHSELLSTQFLIRASKLNHPLNQQTIAPPGAEARNLRPTLHTKFGNRAGHYTAGQVLDDEEYRGALRAVHRDAAQSASGSYTPPVWPTDTPPPIHISSEEQFLPCDTRRTLAQLKSGQSTLLKNYQHRIGQSDTEDCPE